MVGGQVSQVSQEGLKVGGCAGILVTPERVVESLPGKDQRSCASSPPPFA